LLEDVQSSLVVSRMEYRFTCLSSS